MRPLDLPALRAACRRPDLLTAAQLQLAQARLVQLALGRDDGTALDAITLLARLERRLLEDALTQLQRRT